MITAHLAIVVTCEGDNLHCPEYFKSTVDVAKEENLEVAFTVRNIARQAGWDFKDGKDLCPTCKSK